MSADGHVLVRLGVTAPEQQVGLVVTAQHGEGAGAVVFDFQCRDVPGEQEVASRGGLGKGRHPHLGADLGPCFRKHSPVGVAKRQDKKVGLVEVAVDNGRRQEVVDVFGAPRCRRFLS